MITFKNNYFLCEKLEDGSMSTTVLKDDIKYNGICLEGCIFTTDTNGFINDKFTKHAKKDISEFCKQYKFDVKSTRLELRCIALNRLLGMIWRDTTNGE